MTRFGKLLVFIQLLLAFLMLTWAAGLYSQRINWSPRKPLFGGEPTPGLVEGTINNEKVPGDLDELVVKLVDLRDSAEGHWQSAYAGFRRVEEQRLAYLAWYDDQAEQAKTGRNKKKEKVEPPVRVLIRGPDGLLLMEDNKRDPVKAGQVIVKSIDEYQEKYKQIYDEVALVQKELDKLAEQLKDVTEDIAGIPGQTPGLRGRLLAELTFLKLHEDEMQYLAPQLNARRVESQVLERRLRYLKDRRKELYAALGIDKDDEGGGK